MAQNITTYIKNVGKSFGYVVEDVMKEYNPVITSIAKDTKESAKDLYENIKPYVSSKSDIDEKKLLGTVRNTVDDSIKNIFSDLKSGNLYNRSRMKSAEDALAKSVMGDLDFDFDFDFEEDWGDDEESSSSAKDVINNNNDKSTREIISAVDQVGYKVADALGTTTIESADYIVKSSRQDNKAMYALNRRGFSQITSVLLSVNTSIASFSKIGEPLSAHMQNSSVFFTKTTETLNRMDQTLQQIAKNTTPAPSATNGNYNLAKNTLGSVLGDGFDLSSYKEIVKSNIEEWKDMASMITNAMNGMKDESSGSYGKNISLVGMGTKALVKSALPKMFKDSMKEFNESIRNFIGAGLVKARGSSSNSLIVDMLKDMFLPQDGYKKNINTSNYNKGQVAWDGITRKALVEVIPEYLSGIYKVLSGKDKVYDYNRGKFIERSSVQKEIDRDKRLKAQSAGGDFRTDALKSVDNMKEVSEEYKETMKKEIENYFYNSFDKGDDFWNIKNFSNYNKERFGVSDDSIKILVDLLKQYESTPGKRGTANKFITDVQFARDEYGNTKRREESTGTSSEIYLQNNFASEGRVGLTDEFNHTPLFYLAGIYENTGYLADNIGYISGRSRKVNKKNRLKKGDNISSISKPKEDNVSSSDNNDIKSTIKSYTETISSLNEDDIKKEEREENIKGAIEEIKNKSDSWKDSARKVLDKISPKSIKSKIDKPFESVANILDKINVGMTYLIWGKDGNPENGDGFIGYMMDSTKSAFKKFTDKLDEMFPDIKQKFSNFWDKLFGAKGEDGKRHGGKLGEFRDQTREELKNGISWMGQSVKAFFHSGKPKSVENAAYGRQVTKSGIVAVSEGEMIVPSEFNPFYKGNTNKREQIRNERRAISNFYGAFDSGSVSVGDKESDKKGFFESVAEKVANKINDSKNEKRENEGAGHSFIRQGFETLGSGFAEFFARIGGTNDSKQIEKEKKILSENANSIIKEAGINKGAIGAGALIGGGISLLTGAVVGPLFGAAIGGAVGLTLKSEEVQKVLFGDDEGKKGLLPKKVGTFIKDQLPDIGTGTVIGAAGGLFMGSPILGAILGGTVGFVKSSEGAKKFLFGEKELDENGKETGNRTGGVFSKALQEKIKKAIPGISAGMLAGAVVGPFGMVGNLMVGAGIGYLGTSHKFGTWMFGENGQGGFVEKLKTKIFDNIDIITRNFWNRLKARGKNLAKSIGEKITDALTKKAKAAKNGEGGGLIGKVLNFGDRAVNGVTDTVGNFLDRRRSRSVAKNLAGGFQVYDFVEDENGNRVKKTLNAAERYMRRGSNNGSSVNNFDRLLMESGDKSSLVNIKNELKTLRNPKRELENARNKAMTGLYSNLSTLDNRTASKIGKLVSKGKYDAAIKMVNSLNLSPDISIKYRTSIESARIELEKAKDEKNIKDDLINKYSELGIDVSKAGDIEKFITSIDEEMKQRFSDQKVAEQKEEDYKSKIHQYLSDIKDNTEIIASGGKKKIDVSDQSNIIESDTISSWQKTLDNQKESTPITTAFGDIIYTTKDSDGNIIPDIRQNGTREALESMKEMKSGFIGLNKFGSMFSNIRGFFDSFKKSGEDEEKKSGLLGSIKNLLSGEDGGPLSGLFNLFTGEDNLAKTLIKGKLPKLNLKTVLKDLGIITLFTGAITGAFDDIFAKFGLGGENNKKSDIIENTDTGEKYTKDQNGNLVDSEGNIIDSSTVNTRVRGGDINSFSENLQYDTLKGVTGYKSVASMTVGKTGVGKTVSRVAGDVKNVMLNGGKDSVEGIASRMAMQMDLTDGIKQFCSKLSKFCPGLADNIDNITAELAEKMTKSLASESAERIARLASNAVIWAKVAFIVIDFTTGCEDARSTLGIVDEPTHGQRLISGLLRAIKNFIPIISLIPDSFIVDVFCKYVGPSIGVNPEELMKQREEAQAQAEVAGYDDVQKYIKTELKDYTWTERYGNAFKTTWNEMKTGYSNFKNSVQEKGLGATIKDGATDTINTFKEAYSKNGGGIGGAITAIGDTFDAKLPGLLGEIPNKITDIISYASKGEIGNLWKVSLDDFTSDPSKGEVDVTLFSKIFGQLPLIATKLPATPIALISKVGHFIGDLFKPVIDGVKYLIELPATVIKDTEQMMYDENSTFSDFMNLDKYKKDDSSNIFNGIITGVAGVSRIISVPIMVIKKLGKGIASGINKVVEPAKNSVLTLINSAPAIAEKNKAGDISGLLNLTVQENDPDNPVGGITKFFFNTMKIMSVPQTAIHWVGNKVSEAFKTAVGNSKSNFQILSKSIEDLKKYSSDGDISGVMKYEMKLNEDGDLLARFWKVGFTINKVFQTIVATINAFITPIIDGIANIKEKVSNKVGDIKENAGNAISKAGEWAFDKVKGFFSGSGSGVKSGTTNFVSQFDPKYKDMKFGDSTVSQKGCAPAVASMVASQYGRKYTMDQAIKDSTKFQNKDGTSIDYFKSALGSQGITTNYIQGANSAQQITQALANGSQVILLGQDSNNTSKSRSPFGPTNHYVVATGIDANGNLIINDPESDKPKIYSADILRSTSMGISTDSSGSGPNFDTDIARRTWGFFTQAGYSPEATAGIMGNLQQESGMDPTRHQTNGTAAGIAQWEKFGDPTSRWGQLQQHANANGYNWDELDPQLQFIDKELSGLDHFFQKNTKYANNTEFKAATDPMEAMEGFEKAFERAGKPNFANREKYTRAYYNLYADSSYTGSYVPSEPSSEVNTINGATSESSPTSPETGEKKGIVGILTTITSAFSKIGDIFTGSSDSNSSANSTSVVDGASYTPTELGPIPQGKGNSAQKKIVQYAESILNRDDYSQDPNLRTKVGQGYSDCSSFAQWAYKQAINVDPGGNTGAIIDSPLLRTIDEGTTPDVSKLEAGDLMLFKHKSPNGRTKNVGHVEIYDGNGNVIGHGSGKGPTKKSLESYLNTRNKMGGPYIETRRFADIAKLGSTDVTESEVSQQMSAAGSGLFARSSFVNNTKSQSTRNFNGNRFNISGSGTDLVAQSTAMLNDVKTKVQNSSGISAELVQRLIESITNVLNMIANNTAPIEQIYNLLSQYTGRTNSSNNQNTSQPQQQNNTTTSPKESSNGVNDSIRNLAGVLAEIAKG